MPPTTKVRLTSFQHGVHPNGEPWHGSKDTELDLDPETANALVSAGAAVQVKPFEVTENVTSAPPWTPEKIDRERLVIETKADELGQAEQARDRTAAAQERADQAREQAYMRSMDETGAPPATVVTSTEAGISKVEPAPTAPSQGAASAEAADGGKAGEQRGDKYDEMKADELRAEAGRRGLPTSGTKDELAARLRGQ